MIFNLFGLATPYSTREVAHHHQPHPLAARCDVPQRIDHQDSHADGAPIDGDHDLSPAGVLSAGLSGGRRKTLAPHSSTTPLSGTPRWCRGIQSSVQPATPDEGHVGRAGLDDRSIGVGGVTQQLKTPVGVALGQQLYQLPGLFSELAIGALVGLAALLVLAA